MHFLTFIFEHGKSVNCPVSARLIPCGLYFRHRLQTVTETLVETDSDFSHSHAIRVVRSHGRPIPKVIVKYRRRCFDPLLNNYPGSLRGAHRPMSLLTFSHSPRQHQITSLVRDRYSPTEGCQLYYAPFSKSPPRDIQIREKAKAHMS